jgi:hypothetical protein
MVSVRPSVHMVQLGSHWTDFHEMWYLSVFRISETESEVLFTDSTALVIITECSKRALSKAYYREHNSFTQVSHVTGY